MTWVDRARECRSVLVDEYWDSRADLFRIGAGPGRRRARTLPWAPWHYWWQAHALDVVLDGYAAGDPEAGRMAERLIGGIARRNGGDLAENPYFDDLAWMGLAALRAHAAGLTDARTPLRLADAVAGGWDPALGGFRWRRGDDYRNVAATAPAAMLLAAASGVDGDPSRLAASRTAADWLHATLVDPSGIVWDGCRPRAGVLVPEGLLWSYNVGVTAGLDVVLARTGDPPGADRLLSRAASVVRAGTAALRAGRAQVPDAIALVAGRSGRSGPVQGSWRDEPGEGADHHLFRGILARYATELVLADPTATPDISRDVIHQAEAAWAARDSGGRVGAAWGLSGPSQRPGATTLAAHLAGALTMAAAARLEGSGLS